LLNKLVEERIKQTQDQQAFQETDCTMPFDDGSNPCLDRPDKNTSFMEVNKG